jgi:hypothetical protein
LEPISPELALIDPELARADLARLAACAGPELSAYLGGSAGPVHHAPAEAVSGARRTPRSLRSHVTAIFLGISLAANGLLLATVVVPDDTNPPSSGSPIARAKAASRRAAPLRQVLPESRGR